LETSLIEHINLSNNQSRSMVIGKRTSRAVLVLLLAVTLSVSSHVTVEATATVSHQSSRRSTEGRVRGLKKVGIDDEEVAEKLNAPKNNKTLSRNKPKLPGVFRPVPEKLLEAGLNPKLATRPEKPDRPARPARPDQFENNLPESQQDTIKVNNKKFGNDSKFGVGSVTQTQKGTDLAKIGRKNNKRSEEPLGNGLEHFREVEVEIYKREIPSVTIQFTSSSSDTPNLADYNELSDVCEEYLDKFFRSVFEDVQVVHDGTVLFVMVSEDDPYTVDFRITLEFIIPGEVPTINFLIDKLQDGLERDTSKAFFISDLSMMSETNPFSTTDNYRVVSRPPVSVAEMNRGQGNSPVAIIENVKKSHVVRYLLVSMGCVAIVGASLMWKKNRSDQSDASNPKQMFSLFDRRNKEETTTGSTASGIYGADEETMNYLNSIRQRYRDYNGKEKVSPTPARGDNIAAIEQTGSYDQSEDSMSGSVDAGFDDESC